MLVSIALTAATVCTVRACTKRLDETQLPEPETRPTGPRLQPSRLEGHGQNPESRHIAPRPRRWGFCPRQNRDETLVRFETVSRPRRLDRDHIPDTDNVGATENARPDKECSSAAEIRRQSANWQRQP